MKGKTEFLINTQLANEQRKITFVLKKLVLWLGWVGYSGVCAVKE
jgi:hypothetical protein